MFPLDSSTLGWAFGVLLFALLWRWWRRDRSLPPGPRSIPILGYLPFLGVNMADTAMKLSRKYNSDVICLQVGMKTMVMLNSEEAISEAFCSNLFPDRPDYAVKKIHKGRGILSNDGHHWQEQRRLSACILRDLGVGKLRSETKIQEEIHELMIELSQRQGEPRDIHYLLRTAVTNVISCLLFDKRYSYDDETFVNYFKVFSDSLRNLKFVMLLDIFPLLKLIPGDLFRFNRLVNNEAILAGFFGSHVDDHVTSFDPEKIRDFIDAYIAQLPDQNLTEEDRPQLVKVIGDLFKAGGESMSGTLRWAILYMAAHPEIQQRVQDDLDKANKMADAMAYLPSIADKKQLIYTQAVLLEVQRLSAVSVLGTPHSNLDRDVLFRGYRIPAGTTVFGNQWAVFRDPSLWPNPDEFDPRNFLTENGDLRNQERIINFGLGRRRCLGEALAKMMLFLFFSAMLQQFSFSLPEGASKPNMDGVFSIIREPCPFKVIIREKKNSH